MDPKPGGPPPPGEKLTKEQVMAQRAEKKKLKEARKNKSGGGGGDGAKPKSDKPAAPAQGQNSKKEQKPSGTDVSKQDQVDDKSQKERQIKQSPKDKPVANKPSATPLVDASGTASAAPPKTGGGKQAVEASKSAAPVKSEAGTDKPAEIKHSAGEHKTSKSAEYQSAIQSIFRKSTTKLPSKYTNFSLHPLFHNLGVKLKNEVIRGTNLRCVALLTAIKEYVRTFDLPSGMTLKHALSADLKSNMIVLKKKSPFSIAMSNAVEFVHTYLTKLEEQGDVYQIKEDIMEEIDKYVIENIEKAVEAIVLYGSEKIRTGDKLMIYSITEALLNLLEKAAVDDEKSFEIITLHTPETMFDIRLLLERLRNPINKDQVTIRVVNFSSAIYKMRHCTKLVIGGHGLFTTGGVMAQTGSGKLALLASKYNKPAIFLCETYKFCDRSPLDFFTLDEYIPENAVMEENLFEPKIKYDITPASLVTVVITDIDMLPSVSVPIVLRVQEGRVQKNEDPDASLCWETP